MSQDQVKPSAEALHVAKVLIHIIRTGGVSEEDLASVIDDERRKARADAYEHAARFSRSSESSVKSDCCFMHAAWLANCFDAIAAKERAK